MSTEALKKLWAEFDDLASKSESEDVQFLMWRDDLDERRATIKLRMSRQK